MMLISVTKTGIYLIVAAASFYLTKFIYARIQEMLIEAGFVRPNFRKEPIPLGVGLVFFLSALIIVTACRLLGLADSEAYVFLFAVGAMGLFGLIDDVFGTRGASGLKGHFQKLIIEKELTTGALKAIAGLFIALLISLGATEEAGFSRWFFIGLNTLIMALSTNAINLLDLRPGRAGKGFLFISLLIILGGTGSPQLLYLLIIAGSLIAFMPFDLKADAMMGDTGSNMLGMTLGYTAVFVLPVYLKIVYFILLIGFHLLTEKYSLTKIIENNRFLNYIDMMGRRQ